MDLFSEAFPFSAARREKDRDRDTRPGERDRERDKETPDQADHHASRPKMHFLLDSPTVESSNSKIEFRFLNDFLPFFVQKGRGRRRGLKLLITILNENRKIEETYICHLFYRFKMNLPIQSRE